MPNGQTQEQKLLRASRAVEATPRGGRGEREVVGEGEEEPPAPRGVGGSQSSEDQFGFSWYGTGSHGGSMASPGCPLVALYGSMQGSLGPSSTDTELVSDAV